MKSLYLRLAAGNIKNNRRFCLPFLLTAVMTVACFFILCSAGLSQTLPGGQTVILVMRFGVIVVAIFSVIFLYYTNSFLIKRRKKELGLYNILGMEKRHIAKVMLWETLFSALIAIGGGLIAGILLDRLMFLLLLNLIHFDVGMAYALQPAVIAITEQEIDGVVREICASPNDVPGYDKDQYIDPAILANVKGGSYAYCDADGNYYRSGFGLNY